MPQQVVITARNDVRVIEVGPMGPTGPPGSNEGVGGRAGLEMIMPFTETIGEGEEAVEYNTYEIGLSNASGYACVVTDQEAKLLFRVTSPYDATIAQDFMALVIGAGPLNSFFLDIGEFGVIPYNFFPGSSADGTISMSYKCLPAAMLGGPSDMWFPQPTPYALPRVGAVHLTPADADGDGVTAPDCVISTLSNGYNAATVCANVNGKTFPDIWIPAGIGEGRPLRIELKDAGDVTTVRVSMKGNGATYYEDFDVATSGLLHGTSIRGNIIFLNLSDSETELQIDPIGGA